MKPRGKQKSYTSLIDCGYLCKLTLVDEKKKLAMQQDLIILSVSHKLNI